MLLLLPFRNLSFKIEIFIYRDCVLTQYTSLHVGNFPDTRKCYLHILVALKIAQKTAQI